MNNNERLERFKSLIKLIDEPNREKCLKILVDFQDRIEKAPGSLDSHHAWDGGYIDHVSETISVAIRLYDVWDGEREYSFTLSDAILVLFLHDLEKPFKYVEPKKNFQTNFYKHLFIRKTSHKYKIDLSEKQKDALYYIHKEEKDFSSLEEQNQSQLAVFCYMCDMFSAKIWHNYPLQNKPLTEKPV